MKEKIQITAPIKVERKSKSRELAMASVIEFPKNKQPDLMYFSAILVSSGENLNHAYFLPSELVLAENTIVNKAVDREHVEDEVIGHIYDRIYLDKNGKLLELEDLSEHASLDTMDMDIAIAGIIYKNRFPVEAAEVKQGEWAISMEAYFSDYDIKVGDVVLTRKDAEALGLTADHVGQEAEITSANKIIAEGIVARVLRNIVFAGCGIVKDPANPDSVFLEAANLKEQEGDTVNLINIEDVTEGDLMVEIKEEAEQDDAGANPGGYPDTTHTGPGGDTYDTTGQCVSFGRFEEEGHPAEWCKLYDTSCTSSGRVQTDPDCLYYKEVRLEAATLVEAILKEKTFTEDAEKRAERLENLKKELIDIIDRATHHVPKKKATKKKKKTKKTKKKKEC
jgi:hypothetical protein